MRDEVMAAEVRFIRVTRTNSKGGNPNILCLPLDFIPGFLFGISTGRVTKPGVQEKLNRYRRECLRILWQAFRPEIVRADDSAPVISDKGARYVRNRTSVRAISRFTPPAVPPRELPPPPSHPGMQ